MGSLEGDGESELVRTVAWIGGATATATAPTTRRAHRARNSQPGAARTAVEATAGGEAARTNAREATVRVAIADDRPVVRFGLAAMLSTTDRVSVVAASNVAETLAMSIEHRPNVVLLDFDLPKGKGVRATRQVLSRFPETRVIGVTLTDGEGALDALDAGAVGCVFKEDDSPDLLRIIQAAMRGDRSLRPQAVRLLMKRPAAIPPTERLTPREREILALLTKGLSNRAIAERLKLREKTVKSYMTSIFRRLGVESRIQAALWAERRGLSK